MIKAAPEKKRFMIEKAAEAAEREEVHYAELLGTVPMQQ